VLIRLPNDKANTNVAVLKSIDIPYVVGGEIDVSFKWALEYVYTTCVLQSDHFVVIIKTGRTNTCYIDNAVDTRQSPVV
jgi:hypothetical protein